METTAVVMPEVLVPAIQRGNAARSTFYRLLAGLFAFPEGEVSSAAHAQPQADQLRAVLAELPHPAEAKQAMSEVLDAIDAWTTTAPDAADPVEAIYTELFLNCRGRAAVSLYEKDYGNGDAKMVWEEVIRFYEHFGLEFDVRVRKDWPDHLGTELEFMHYLTFLEATASADDQAAFHQAQGDFLSRRLGRWAARFARQVHGAEQNGPYGDYADLIEAFVTAEMALLGQEYEALSPWVPMNEAGTGGTGKHWIPIVQQPDQVPDWEMEEPFR